MEKQLRRKYGNAIVSDVINMADTSSYSEAYGYYEAHNMHTHLHILKLLQSGGSV